MSGYLLTIGDYTIGQASAPIDSSEILLIGQPIYNTAQFRVGITGAPLLNGFTFGGFLFGFVGDGVRIDPNVLGRVPVEALFAAPSVFEGEFFDIRLFDDRGSLVDVETGSFVTVTTGPGEILTLSSATGMLALLRAWRRRNRLSR